MESLVDVGSTASWLLTVHYSSKDCTTPSDTRQSKEELRSHVRAVLRRAAPAVSFKGLSWKARRAPCSRKNFLALVYGEKRQKDVTLIPHGDPDIFRPGIPLALY